MITNQQAVINAEAEIERLKHIYMEHLTSIVFKIREKQEYPSLQELITCQKLGASYFNFVENFVGNSGLLGAHVNGKWVTGFAETCHSVLRAFLVHVNFLRSHSETLEGALEQPDETAYANMQRMTKEYMQKKDWEKLKALFKENNLPTTGFEYSGAYDMNETPKWQLIVALIIGVLFAVAILLLAVLIPNPSLSQFFIFRGFFAISLAAIAAIIPGLLTVESRFQKFSIRATGAIAVFIIVWFLNPPALFAT